MNKSLLILAAAIMGTGYADAQLRTRATAAEPQPQQLKIHVSKASSATDALVTNPAGTAKDYAMSLYLYVNALQPDYDEYDVKSTLVYSADGKTIWFRDLFMGEMDGYAKGDVSGKTVTIASGQYVANSAKGEKLYLLAFTGESDGSATLADGITFTIADGVLRGVNDNVYAGLWTYDEKNKQFALTNDYAHKYTFNEVTQPNSATVPADAVKEQYMMSFYDGWRSGNYKRVVDVARKGNDIYMNGLSFLSRYDYFKGTVNGGEAVFESDQTVSSDYTYWTKIVGAKNDGSISPDFTFTIASDGSMTLKNLGLYEKMMFDNSNYDLYQNVTLKKYAGDVAATPATPKYLKCADTADFSNKVTFVMPCTDVDGNDLNPDLLYYRFYVDGNLYTFTPARYQGLSQEMTDVPYSYYNSYTFNDNYQNKYKLFYLDESVDWRKLEVESVYIVNGEERVSPERSVYYDPDSVDEIDGSAEIVSVRYVDMLGRPVNKPTAGGVYIKSTTFDNGTVRNEKVTISNENNK